MYSSILYVAELKGSIWILDVGVQNMSPQIYHFGTLIILSWSIWERHNTGKIPWPSFVFLRAGAKSSMKSYLPCTRREEGILSARHRNLELGRLHKQAWVLLHHFTTLSTHLFVISLSKRYKNFPGFVTFSSHIFMGLLYVQN